MSQCPVCRRTFATKAALARHRQQPGNSHNKTAAAPRNNQNRRAPASSRAGPTNPRIPAIERVVSNTDVLPALSEDVRSGTSTNVHIKSWPISGPTLSAGLAVGDKISKVVFEQISLNCPSAWAQTAVLITANAPPTATQEKLLEVIRLGAFSTHDVGSALVAATINGPPILVDAVTTRFVTLITRVGGRTVDDGVVTQRILLHREQSAAATASIPSI